MKRTKVKTGRPLGRLSVMADFVCQLDCAIGAQIVDQTVCWMFLCGYLEVKLTFKWVDLSKADYFHIVYRLHPVS